MKEMGDTGVVHPVLPLIAGCERDVSFFYVESERMEWQSCRNPVNPLDQEVLSSPFLSESLSSSSHTSGPDLENEDLVNRLMGGKGSLLLVRLVSVCASVQKGGCECQCECE